MFLDKGESFTLESATVTATRPSILVIKASPVQTSLYLEGSLVGESVPATPAYFRLGPNVFAENFLLRQKPNTEIGHTAIFRSPLVFDKLGRRNFQVRISSHRVSAQETLAVGARFSADVPALATAEFIDEVDKIVAWGFSGLVLIDGDFQTSDAIRPSDLREGDILTVAVHNGNMEISVNRKLKLTQQIPPGLSGFFAFPVLDLIGGCSAVEVLPSEVKAVALAPVGRNLVSLGPNAVGYRPKAKPEARTAVSAAPLGAPNFELSVLQCHTSPTDSEGLTLGFAWNPDSMFNFEPDLESPDLIVSDKLWLVGFDGKFYDGASFHASNFHGRVSKVGDVVTVAIVDGYMEVRRNNEVVFRRELDDLPEGQGSWWAVVDLMGGVSAVAAFVAEARVTQVSVESLSSRSSSVRSLSEVEVDSPVVLPSKLPVVVPQPSSDDEEAVQSDSSTPSSQPAQMTTAALLARSKSRESLQAPSIPSAAPAYSDEAKSPGILSRIKSSVASRLPTKLGIFSTANGGDSSYASSARGHLVVSESFRVSIGATESSTSSFVQTDKHPHVDSDDTPVSSAVSSLPSDAEYVPPDEKEKPRS